MVFIIFVAAFVPAAPVALAPVGTGRQTSSVAAQTVDDVCSMLAAGPIPLKLGDCFKFDRSTEPTFRNEACSFLRDTGQLADYEFGSYAGCVRHLLDM
jgi:hypothetical protein